MNDQVVDLQTRLAFQEHTISELNHVLTDQQKQIDRLVMQVQMLQEELESRKDVSGFNPEAEKPPHY